jgi:hypothetical protein
LSSSQGCPALHAPQPSAEFTNADNTATAGSSSTFGLVSNRTARLGAASSDVRHSWASNIGSKCLNLKIDTIVLDMCKELRSKTWRQRGFGRTYGPQHEVCHICSSLETEMQLSLVATLGQSDFRSMVLHMCLWGFPVPKAPAYEAHAHNSPCIVEIPTQKNPCPTWQLRLCQKGLDRIVRKPPRCGSINRSQQDATKEAVLMNYFWC